MNILAIESSFNESSAVVSSNGKICSNVVDFQYIHPVFGGAISTSASDALESMVLPFVDDGYQLAKVTKKYD